MPQDFTSLHSTFVTNVSLPILFLCWNNSLPSLQFTHPHPSKLLRQSHILPSVLHCTDVFLEQKRCLFPKRPGCLFHDTSICLALCSSSPPAEPSSVVIRNSHNPLGLLWFPSFGFLPEGWGFLPAHDPWNRECCRLLWLPPWHAWPCSVWLHMSCTLWAEQPRVCLAHLSTLLGPSAGICQSSKICSLALGRISLATCRIQHRGLAQSYSAPCRAPSASGGAEPLPEESGGSLQHIQQPPLRASSKSFRLFPPLLQVLKWSSQPQA